MIRFVVAAGQGYTLEQVQAEPRAPEIDTISYDRLIGSRRVKAATYVFTDFDRLSHGDLELAGLLYLHLAEAGLKVLNNPARVRTRYALLRALARHGLNDFQVYPADELPDAMRFPVFVREARGHGPLCSGLLESRPEVDRAIEAQVAGGMAAAHLMVIEYAGEPVRPGLYRKLAAFRAAEAVVASPCVHDHQWLVKRGPTCFPPEDLYAEDLARVRDNRDAAYLRKAFELAHIEYGRADYGYFKGRPQIFEINTNPHIFAPVRHPSPLRMETQELAWDGLIAALRAIDSPAGPDVPLPRHPKLNRHRRWTKIFHRSRPGPS